MPIEVLIAVNDLHLAHEIHGTMFYQNDIESQRRTQELSLQKQYLRGKKINVRFLFKRNRLHLFLIFDDQPNISRELNSLVGIADFFGQIVSFWM